MSVDPNADKWVAMPDGRRVALEICDPCEADTNTKAVTILGRERNVLVSAFVGPEWFQPGGFELSLGGYMIVHDHGEVFPVFADDAARAAVAAKFANPTSRLNGRGALE